MSINICSSIFFSFVFIGRLENSSPGLKISPVPDVNKIGCSQVTSPSKLASNREFLHKLKKMLFMIPEIDARSLTKKNCTYMP